MAWTTDQEIKDAMAAVIGLAEVDAGSLPTKFNEVAVAANRRAYNRIRSILAGRGFTPAQMDAWDEREDFNRAGALCYAFRDAALRDEKAPQVLIEYCKVWEELKTVDLIADGVILDPASGAGSVSFGSFDTTGDTFTPDSIL